MTVPSNARRAPHAHIEREWDRRDPVYDTPRPFDWHELLDPWLWMAAVAGVLGLIAFCVWMFAIVPGPK